MPELHWWSPSPIKIYNLIPYLICKILDICEYLTHFETWWRNGWGLTESNCPILLVPFDLQEHKIHNMLWLLWIIYLLTFERCRWRTTPPPSGSRTPNVSSPTSEPSRSIEIEKLLLRIKQFDAVFLLQCRVPLPLSLCSVSSSESPKYFKYSKCVVTFISF